MVRLRDGAQMVQPLEVPISGSAAIDMGPDTDQVYLVLFGTGIRYRSSLSNVTVDIGGAFASVEYAGAQGTFPGVNQVSLTIPHGNLAHAGAVARGENGVKWLRHAPT